MIIICELWQHKYLLQLHVTFNYSEKIQNQAEEGSLLLDYWRTSGFGEPSSSQLQWQIVHSGTGKPVRNVLPGGLHFFVPHKGGWLFTQPVAAGRRGCCVTICMGAHTRVLVLPFQGSWGSPMGCCCPALLPGWGAALLPEHLCLMFSCSNSLLDGLGHSPSLPISCFGVRGWGQHPAGGGGLCELSRVWYYQHIASVGLFLSITSAGSSSVVCGTVCCSLVTVYCALAELLPFSQVTGYSSCHVCRPSVCPHFFQMTPLWWLQPSEDEHAFSHTLVGL